MFNHLLLDKMMLKEYRKKIFITQIYPIGYAMLNFNFFFIIEYKTRVHVRE
jgi:hypothetical protein